MSVTIDRIWAHGKLIEVETTCSDANQDRERKRAQRHIGVPLAFLVDVRKRTKLAKDGATLIVAMLIYRRAHVCKSRTVTLPLAELTELGVNKDQKYRALAKLETAGLIRVERAVGRTSRVTLLWPD